MTISTVNFCSRPTAGMLLMFQYFRHYYCTGCAIFYCSPLVLKITDTNILNNKKLILQFVMA